MTASTTSWHNLDADAVGDAAALCITHRGRRASVPRPPRHPSASGARASTADTFPLPENSKASTFPPMATTQRCSNFHAAAQQARHGAAKTSKAIQPTLLLGTRQRARALVAGGLGGSPDSRLETKEAARQRQARRPCEAAQCCPTVDRCIGSHHQARSP